ncbi:hypothetical protein D3C86_983950 [compost metagenome]
MQHVAGPQRATAMTTKLTKREGTFAAQIVRHLQAAAQAQIAARTCACDGAKAQHCARWNQQCRVHRYAFAVQSQRNHRASHRHHRLAIEAQQRPAHGDFQRRRAFVVAQQTVAQSQRTTVHRTRRRHTDCPVTEATGIVLHAGLGAGADHLERIGLIHQPFQTAGPRLAAGEGRIEQNLPQIIAVGFHAIQLTLAEGLMQIGAGLFASRCPADDLGDHRVEVRWNLAASLDPRVDAQLFAVGRREIHGSQQAWARLKIPARIFRIQPCLNRMAVGFQTLDQFTQRR